MIEEIKEHKRIFESEKSNAIQHYNNSIVKGAEYKKERWRKHIKAFDYAIKKASAEILKIDFNLSVMGSALCPTCRKRLDAGSDFCSDAIHKIYEAHLP